MPTSPAGFYSITVQFRDEVAVTVRQFESMPEAEDWAKREYRHVVLAGGKIVRVRRAPQFDPPIS